MGLSLSLHCSQNPVKLVCHCSDWFPALFSCLPFTSWSAPFRPRAAPTQTGPLVSTHQLPQVHSSRPFLPLPLLCFPTPLPLLPSLTSPSGRKDLGHMPGAGGRSAFHLEEILHFSPLTQKNMVLRKLVFSTERSQRKKKRGGGGACSPS